MLPRIKHSGIPSASIYILYCLLRLKPARIFSSRMTFLLWIVTGHVPSRTCFGYAKTADNYRRVNIAKNVIELHEALLEEWDNIPQRCSASRVHSMDRICRDRLLESDTRIIVKNIS